MVTVPDLPKATFVRQDLFPATVKGDAIAAGVVDSVRAIVTDVHFHVFRLTPEGNIELLYSFEIDSVGYIDGKRERGTRVVTVDDGEITFMRSGGCGCGMTRLKSTRVFPYPVPMVKME